jgi:hypothetical protein
VDVELPSNTAMIRRVGARLIIEPVQPRAHATTTAFHSPHPCIRNLSWYLLSAHAGMSVRKKTQRRSALCFYINWLRKFVPHTENI